jgi:predicted nucleic acid-binding protein
VTAPLCVVTNNTPVSNLLRIGQLQLLGRLFGQLLVPEEVVAELDCGRHLHEVRPWIDALERQGFRLGAAVEQHVLEAAGEAL